MELLKKGMKGAVVGEWQTFLRGANCYFGVVDNDFGNKTHAATIKFQKKYKLTADGVVGRMTYAKAMSLGFGDVDDDDMGENSVNFPPKPTSFSALTGSQKEQMFGKIEYVAAPTDKNPEAIKITNGFKKDNIVLFENPYLAKTCGGKYKRMRFHKKCKYQMLQMWKEWDEAGLLHLVISYGGTYIARFIRGSRTSLSNHSYGTAFDINMAQNGLGRTPALVGKKGSVRKLVEIAHKWGFYWGGHFSRKDGMHFEVYKIIPDPNG